MKKNIIYGFLALAALVQVGCKPEFENVTSQKTGTADFAKFIAVGNSLTSGFADGGLYLEGQKVAYPNIMADQFKNVGGGSFTSPFFSAEQANGSGYLYLQSLVNGSPVLGQVTDKLAYRDGDGNLTKYTEEVQNLGIPGMRVDLAFSEPYAAGNPYMERLLNTGQIGTVNYFQFVQGRNHTFFSLWLGNNDVLGYATNGGVVTDFSNSLTDKSTFSYLYSNLINSLSANGQKGIVATIPDVTIAPYFNTVTTSLLIQAAKAVNPNITDIYIQTEGSVRKATSKDLIRLPFQNSELFAVPNQAGEFYGLHPNNPITSEWVLDEAEVLIVKDYINSYNSSIKSLAGTKGIAIADVYNYVNTLKNGAHINGINVNTNFITGGAFSLDGLHLTPLGNALIANLFIESINKKYGSNVSIVDVTKYRGVIYPN